MNTNDCALGTNKMYSNLSVFLCLCMKWLISRQGNGYSTNMSKTVYKIQHEELGEGDNKPVDSFYASISVRPKGMCGAFDLYRLPHPWELGPRVDVCFLRGGVGPSHSVPCTNLCTGHLGIEVVWLKP